MDFGIMSYPSDSTKIGAKLLLEGAKMLNIPCPVCRNPIYQLRDDRLYCASCKKQVIRENSEAESSMEATTESTQDPITSKINQLKAQLDQETDSDKIVQLAETIKKLQNIQKKSE